MTIRQGANTAELRLLGKQFAAKATAVRNAQGSLDQLASKLPSVWVGSDSDELLQTWTRIHRPTFQRLAEQLGDAAKTLAANADAQERVSNDLGGPGPGAVGPGAPGGANQGGFSVSGAFLGAGALAVGGLKTFMGVQKLVKAPFTLAKVASQYKWVLDNERTAFIKSFQQGFHRVGGPGIRLGRLLSNRPLDELLSTAGKSGGATGALTRLSDLTSLKNLNKLPGLDNNALASRIFEEKPWIGAGTKLEWLGKSGLGRTLGWAGVGFSAYDAYQGFSSGDYSKGLAGLGKTALGVGCFLPPPAGTVCQVASVGIALYENREAIWNGTKAVAGAVASGAEHVAGAVADGAKSVAHFFGF
ncbi:MAG: WXG100 family type VII secretion target [Sinomonas sp.]|nr:WXG100 family type VII secretion target [Sinomonas sp.]